MSKFDGVLEHNDREVSLCIAMSKKVVGDEEGKSDFGGGCAKFSLLDGLI